MKPTRHEMDYAVGPFRSQHVAPVGPYLLSRQIRIGSVSTFSCVMRRQQCEWFFLFPPHPTIHFDVVCQLHDLRHKQRTNFLLVEFIGFILAVGTSDSKSYSSSSFPFRHLHLTLQSVQILSPNVTRSVFRLFFPLTSALLCHTRFNRLGSTDSSTFGRHISTRHLSLAVWHPFHSLSIGDLFTQISQ